MLKSRTSEQFFASEGIGALMRVHAAKESDVASRVALARAAVDRLASFKAGARAAVKQVIILVWADPSYPGKSDCGKTAEALKEALHDAIEQNYVRIDIVERGDLFCSILNRGCAQLLRNGIDWGMILSPEAVSYLTNETFDAMIATACDGVRAVGVGLTELFESIMERGRIANTLALWHLESLAEVGGFDLAAAHRHDDRDTPYLKGRDEKGVERFYALAGVEEVIPLARLVDTFGSCIGVVEPRGGGVQRYVRPIDPELLARYLAKMATKEGRQEGHLIRAGYTGEMIMNGIAVRKTA